MKKFKRLLLSKISESIQDLMEEDCFSELIKMVLKQVHFDLSCHGHITVNCPITYGTIKYISLKKLTSYYVNSMIEINSLDTDCEKALMEMAKHFEDRSKYIKRIIRKVKSNDK